MALYALVLGTDVIGERSYQSPPNSHTNPNKPRLVPLETVVSPAQPWEKRGNPYYEVVAEQAFKYIPTISKTKQEVAIEKRREMKEHVATLLDTEIDDQFDVLSFVLRMTHNGDAAAVQQWVRDMRATRSGHRQAVIALINDSGATPEDVYNYDVTTGWPALP